MKRVKLGDVAVVDWGDTSTTKASYVDRGYVAFSATGADGFLPYYDHDRDAVILSAIGARCGKTWFTTGKWSSIKNTITLWAKTEELDNRYLYWATSDPAFWPKRGAAQPFITIGDARNSEICLPPLNQQKRITAILDQADNLRRLRQCSIERVNKLGQMIFHEMFGDWDQPGCNMPLIKLGDVLDFMTSGSRGWANYYREVGSLFLRIQNVRRDHLDLSDVTYVDAPSTAEAKRTAVQAGDVLLSITADLGRTAVVPEDLGKAYINQHLSILRSKHFQPRFLSAALASPAGQRVIKKRNREGVKAGLNFDDIRSLQLPNASRILQETFVRRITQADALKKDCLLAADATERLFLSIQARAFSGQL